MSQHHLHPADEPPARLEDLLRLCADHGVSLTEPRRVVLEVLADLGTHPTADELHEAALRRRPGLGRATVYRALDDLHEAGIIAKACHPGAAVRYDARRTRHHHLVCVRCERITDITDERLDAVPVPDVSEVGFAVRDVQVQLRGLCRACQRKETEP